MEWFPTYSCKKVFFENPQIEDISILDIAGALSKICRFNGHTHEFYSVAQHSLLVAGLVELNAPEFTLFALLHDAPEAYLGDVTTPLKRLLKEIYGPLEERFMEVVAEKFGFADQLNNPAALEAIKKADRIALVTEARDLTGYGSVVDDVKESPIKDYVVTPWSCSQARKAFISAYNAII